MNKEKRRAVGASLRAWRVLLRQPCTEAAKILNWPLDIYLAAERGDLSLSAGQQADVRRAMKHAINRRNN